MSARITVKILVFGHHDEYEYEYRRWFGRHC